MPAVESSTYDWKEMFEIRLRTKTVVLRVGTIQAGSLGRHIGVTPFIVHLAIPLGTALREKNILSDAVRYVASPSNWATRFRNGAGRLLL